MTLVFALAVGLSATLLFMLQPLTGKLLLPALGGSPAVWSTCLVFFQALLLIGYLYAHGLSTRLPMRWQAVVHLCVLATAGLVLPLSADVGEPQGVVPRRWLLELLARSVGLPFFALAATAPLLQHWFSRTDHPRAADPYFLYAASNAGSLLGLLGYLAIEPAAPRAAQLAGWRAGFWAFAILAAGAAYAAWRRAVPRPGRPRSGAQSSIPLSRRATWVVLAMVPSAMLLGVTQHLATDVVSAPLLWVLPLVLYLATFVAAFGAPKRTSSARRWGAAAAWAAVVVLALSLADVRYPILAIALVHLAAFTSIAMLCHVRLAGLRPEPAHLTGYFLSISLGGVLGGVAAALAAPIAFDSILEYPLTIGAALLLRPQAGEADRLGSPRARLAGRVGAVALAVAGTAAVAAFNDWTDDAAFASSPIAAQVARLAGDPESAARLLRTCLTIPVVLLLLRRRTALLFAGAAAGLLVGAAAVRTGGELLHQERTFFGVHQVSSLQDGAWHVLTHGTTTHGVQATRGRLRSLPTAYYHPTGPIGDLAFTLAPAGRLRDVAVVGLGAGALAAYAGNGVRMDFFEIDDEVIRIAEDPRYFTYLSDARSRAGTTITTRPVDGRLALRAASPASYDLVVVDAFSSDAVPTHLITSEAVAIYESRLKSRGVIAFHVSSRFFDLAPVLARIAVDRGLVCFARDDRDVPPERAAEAKRASVWVVLAKTPADLGEIPRSSPRWVALDADADVPLWTDDYTNVIGALVR